MTLSVSIDEQIAQRAREVAESRGMSLDELIRHYLEDLTMKSSAQEDMAEIRRLSGQGNSHGWKFNRDEVHERS
jgi:antitoxin component of RelBE/YafQ-DinJ toxin-antitoxin module